MWCVSAKNTQKTGRKRTCDQATRKRYGSRCSVRTVLFGLVVKKLIVVLSVNLSGGHHASAQTSTAERGRGECRGRREEGERDNGLEIELGEGKARDECVRSSRAEDETASEQALNIRIGAHIPY